MAVTGGKPVAPDVGTTVGRAAAAVRATGASQEAVGRRARTGRRPLPSLWQEGAEIQGRAEAGR